MFKSGASPEIHRLWCVRPNPPPPQKKKKTKKKQQQQTNKKKQKTKTKTKTETKQPPPPDLNGLFLILSQRQTPSESNIIFKHFHTVFLILLLTDTCIHQGTIRLNHWSLVAKYGVIELGKHCLTTPSHYLIDQMLACGPSRTSSSEMSISTDIFVRKMYLKTSSAKYRPIYEGTNVLTDTTMWCAAPYPNQSGRSAKVVALFLLQTLVAKSYDFSHCMMILWEISFLAPNLVAFIWQREKNFWFFDYHLLTCSVRKMVLMCLMQNIDMCLLYKSHQIARLVSHLINHFSKWMFTM